MVGLEIDEEAFAGGLLFDERVDGVAGADEFSTPPTAGGVVPPERLAAFGFDFLLETFKSRACDPTEMKRVRRDFSTNAAKSFRMRGWFSTIRSG